jgi:hypothetical protein
MEPTTPWERRLEMIAELKDGWDGYKSSAIEPATIRQAAVVIRALIQGGMSVPFVYPTRDGTVFLEWDGRENLSVEIHACEL